MTQNRAVEIRAFFIFFFHKKVRAQKILEADSFLVIPAKKLLDHSINASIGDVIVNDGINFLLTFVFYSYLFISEKT